MTTPAESQDPSQTRRPFAARYAHRGGGLFLAVLGALGCLGYVIALIRPETTAADNAVRNIPVLVVSVVLVVWAVYLLRGRGVDQQAAERRAVGRPAGRTQRCGGAAAGRA
ncbi:MAG: hypothetical protein FWD11_08500 [Micrococcales bacterium]|nr:hypothetical protein [Micrococcales bacterium]